MSVFLSQSVCVAPLEILDFTRRQEDDKFQNPDVSLKSEIPDFAQPCRLPRCTRRGARLH